jgi:hypothetical protein
MKSIAVFAAVLLLGACASTGIQRIGADDRKDLSGYWNANDVKEACDALIEQCLNSKMMEEVLAKEYRGQKPYVAVGKFRNESSEYIDTVIISGKMEVAIFESGKLRFVAGGEILQELREENMERLKHAEEGTGTGGGEETAADFLLTGSVRTMLDQNDGLSTRTYLVRAELYRMGKEDAVWMGAAEVNKEINRRRVKL